MADDVKPATDGTIRTIPDVTDAEISEALAVWSLYGTKIPLHSQIGVNLAKMVGPLVARLGVAEDERNQLVAENARVVALTHQWEDNCARLSALVRELTEAFRPCEQHPQPDINCETCNPGPALALECAVLRERVRELEAGLQRFAGWGQGWNPSWPDSMRIDETNCDDCPTLGDCRHAARLLGQSRPTAESKP